MLQVNFSVEDIDSLLLENSWERSQHKQGVGRDSANMIFKATSRPHNWRLSHMSHWQAH